MFQEWKIGEVKKRELNERMMLHMAAAGSCARGVFVMCEGAVK